MSTKEVPLKPVPNPTITADEAQPEGSVLLIAIPEKETLGVGAKSVKRNGPVRFPSIVRGEGDVGVEVNGSFIAPGSSNSFTLTEFERMKTNPYFAKQIKTGAIEVVYPTVEAGTRATNTTLDYSLEDAYRVIEQSTDADWLNRSVTRDDREGIAEAVQARRLDLDAMIKSQGV